MAELAEVFEYLDELRASGRTNMYGAAAYLIEEMDLGRREARAVLQQWMDTFSHDETPEQRAAKVTAE